MLSWDELDRIAQDYINKKDEHTATVQNYVKKIQQCAYVHSCGYRVKEVTHLIEKIIRKNPKYLKQGKAILCDNYTEYITDLMGIRILLLFKEDWTGIHDYLMKEYSGDLAEEPFAYIRKGDDRSLYEGKVRIVEEKPYRSVHYLIRDKKTGLCIEVQVRTLFEEAWSEIDHKVRKRGCGKSRKIGGTGILPFKVQEYKPADIRAVAGGSGKRKIIISNVIDSHHYLGSGGCFFTL